MVPHKVVFDVDVLSPFALEILRHPDASSVVLEDRYEFDGLQSEVVQKLQLSQHSTLRIPPRSMMWPQ